MWHRVVHYAAMTGWIALALAATIVVLEFLTVVAAVAFARLHDGTICWKRWPLQLCIEIEDDDLITHVYAKGLLLSISASAHPADDTPDRNTLDESGSEAHSSRRDRDHAPRDRDGD